MDRISITQFCKRYGVLTFFPRANNRNVLDGYAQRNITQPGCSTSEDSAYPSNSSSFAHYQEGELCSEPSVVLHRIQQLSGYAVYAIQEPSEDLASKEEVKCVRLADLYVRSGFRECVFSWNNSSSAEKACVDEGEPDEMTFDTFAHIHENALMAFEGASESSVVENGVEKPLMTMYLLHPELSSVLATILMVQEERTPSPDDGNEEGGDMEESSAASSRFFLRMYSVCEAPDLNRTDDEEEKAHSGSLPPYRLTQEKLDVVRSFSDSAEKFFQSISSSSSSSSLSVAIKDDGDDHQRIMSISRHQFFHLHLSLSTMHASSVPFSAFRTRMGAVNFVHCDSANDRKKYKILRTKDTDTDIDAEEHANEEEKEDEEICGYLVRRCQHHNFATYTVLAPDDYTIVYPSIQLADLYVEQGEEVLCYNQSDEQEQEKDHSNDENNERETNGGHKNPGLSLDDIIWMHGGLLLDASPTQGQYEVVMRHPTTGRPLYVAWHDVTENGIVKPGTWSMVLDPLIHKYKPTIYEFKNARMSVMDRLLDAFGEGEQQKVLRGVVDKSEKSSQGRLDTFVERERAKAGMLEMEVERRTRRWTQKNWFGLCVLEGADEAGFVDGAPTLRHQQLRWIQQSLPLLPDMSPKQIREQSRQYGDTWKTHLTSALQVDRWSHQERTGTLSMAPDDIVECSQALDAVIRGYVSGTTAYEVFGGVTLRQSMYSSDANNNTDDDNKDTTAGNSQLRMGTRIMNTNLEEKDRVPYVVDYASPLYGSHAVDLARSSSSLLYVKPSKKTQIHEDDTLVGTIEKDRVDADETKTQHYGDVKVEGGPTTQSTFIMAGTQGEKRSVSYDVYTYRWQAYNPQLNRTEEKQHESVPGHRLRENGSMKGSLTGAYFEKRYRDPKGMTVRFRTFSVEGTTGVSTAVNEVTNIRANVSAKPVYKCVSRGAERLKETTVLEASGCVGVSTFLQPMKRFTRNDEAQLSAKVFGHIRKDVSSSGSLAETENINNDVSAGVNVEYNRPLRGPGDESTVGVGGNLYAGTTSDGSVQPGVDVYATYRTSGDSGKPMTEEDYRSIEQNLQTQLDNVTTQMQNRTGQNNGGTNRGSSPVRDRPSTPPSPPRSSSGGEGNGPDYHVGAGITPSGGGQVTIGIKCTIM